MKNILKREMLVCYEKVLIEEEKSQATKKSKNKKKKPATGRFRERKV